MKRILFQVILKGIVNIFVIVVKIKTFFMGAYDPMKKVEDKVLDINESVLKELEEFYNSPKCIDLPGIDIAEEKERLTDALNVLAKELIDHIQDNPSKLWVMQQFQTALIKVQDEDTEARECFGVELERIMDILNIESSNQLLTYYLV